MKSRLCFAECEALRRDRHLETRINALKGKVSRNLEAPNEYFGNPEFSDFRIQAGERTFYVTKYQLALKSKVFARMLMVCMKEKNEGVMRLDEDPESVEAMLNFIYMYIRVKGGELAKKVIHLAHRYELDELKDQCEFEIVKHLTAEDAEESLFLASQLKLSLLFLKCNQILYFNFTHFEENSISCSTDQIWFDDYGFCYTSLEFTNHTNTRISFAIYSCDPLTQRMWFQVIEPAAKMTLSDAALRYINCPARTMGLIYYGPYVENCYVPLHLRPGSRFLSLEIGLLKSDKIVTRDRRGSEPWLGL
uniref:BTB domain-containing protein n=1 Tax=Bursaphelenchus xylophilus TaxID=6326 RepID=A0A1I7SK32_BURXY